jgi:hypothetical protein
MFEIGPNIGSRLWGVGCQVPTNIANVGSRAPAPHIGNGCGDMGGQLPTVGTPCLDLVQTARVELSTNNRSSQGPVETTTMITDGFAKAPSGSATRPSTAAAQNAAGCEPHGYVQ